MRNAVGRDIPEHILGYRSVKPFGGAPHDLGVVTRAPVKVASLRPGKGKVLPGLRAAIEAV